jgi:putative acetyltransferase
VKADFCNIQFKGNEFVPSLSHRQRYMGEVYPMQMRLAQESDIPELAALYQHTVIEHAPQKYSPAQTEVWASFATETEQFRHFILQARTYVAFDETGILGFAGLEANGHISSVYVRGDRLNQRIGSTLIQVLLDYATQHQMTRLYAEASEFSLGLFKKFGFQVYGTEISDYKNVQFTRHLVELVVLEESL